MNVRRANQGHGPPGRHQRPKRHHKHHHHHHHHQVHVHPVNGRQMVAALEVSGFSTSTPDHSKKLVVTSESSAKLSEQNRQLDLDLRLAAISRIQQRYDMMRDFDKKKYPDYTTLLVKNLQKNNAKSGFSTILYSLKLIFAKLTLIC